MLTETPPSPILKSASLKPGRDDAVDGAVEVIEGAARTGLLLLCDHASNALPEGYGTLGLAAEEFSRHIAYDIGAAEVTRRLADMMKAPALLGRYSRLLIDLNRGEDDPTLVMKLSDGAIVPANRLVDPYRDAEEFQNRLTRFHQPYHRAVAGALQHLSARGHVPVIISIHSFTPAWRGVQRPWHTGVLWDRDHRVPEALFEGFAREGGLTVGDNLPYIGYLKGDTLYRHGTVNGYAHALIEIRQDLIAAREGQAEWAARLARLLTPILERGDIARVQHFGSRSHEARG